MPTLLDANCILRYLLSDVPEQEARVAQAVAEGACTAPEFLSECVYVLSGSVYGFDRVEVAEALLACLDEIDCEHLPAMKVALDIYAEGSLDFADCILAARHEVEDAPVMTFDKKLRRLIERREGLR